MAPAKVFTVLVLIGVHALHPSSADHGDARMQEVLESLSAQVALLSGKVARLETVVKEQSDVISEHERTIEEQTKELRDLRKYEGRNDQESNGKEVWKKERRFLDTAPGKVAFSAFLSLDLNGMNGSQNIIFDSVILNEGGNYNRLTGLFTASYPGVYLFSFSVNTFKDIALWVDLVVNGKAQSNIIIWPHFSPSANIQGSNTVLFRLDKGDNVWVAVNPQSYGTSVHGGSDFRISTFSGVFMYD